MRTASALKVHVRRDLSLLRIAYYIDLLAVPLNRVCAVLSNDDLFRAQNCGI